MEAAVLRFATPAEHARIVFGRDQNAFIEVMSRMLQEISLGTLPMFQGGTATLHNTITIERLGHLAALRAKYTGPVTWAGNGIYSVVIAAHLSASNAPVALKLSLATGALPTGVILREQAISAFISSLYPTEVACPVVRTLDLWNVIESFTGITEQLGDATDVVNARYAQAAQTLYRAKKTDPLPDFADSRYVTQWFAVEMEFVEIDLKQWVTSYWNDVPGHTGEQLDVLLKMCFAVIVQLDYAGVSHFDLHSENIRLKNLGTERRVAYVLPDGTTAVFKTAWLPKFSDFGRARVENIYLPGSTTPETVSLASEWARSYSADAEKAVLQRNMSYDAFRLALSIVDDAVNAAIGKPDEPNRPMTRDAFWTQFKTKIADATAVPQILENVTSASAQSFTKQVSAPSLQLKGLGVLLNTHDMVTPMSPVLENYNFDVIALIGPTTASALAGDIVIPLPRLPVP